MMPQAVPLTHYQQQISDYYGARKDTYGRGGQQPHYAKVLVQFVGINDGDFVLDLATGTGLVAIEAAKLVGKTGKIIGVDICEPFMEVARQNIKQERLDNIEIISGNIEDLNLPKNLFDKILLASALPYVSNVQQVISQWMQLLKPGGTLGIQCQSGSAAIGGVVLQKIAKKYGTYINMSDDTKDEATCRLLFKQCGYQNFEIKQEQLGSFIDVQNVLNIWEGSKKHPMCYPFFKSMEVDVEKQAYLEYKTEIEKLNTSKGIWNDMTIYYLKGQRPLM